jgi:hypothetical protein
VSSIATRPLALARARPAGWAVTAAGLAGLLAVSVWLRTTAMDAGFWIDEGLAVGVASHPFFDIPAELRKDGSPPLYYLLLHLWMQGFGIGETATHSLSLIFALLFVPAAFWAGRSLFGPRAGWIAALMGAINPFLTYYAQETRMYSLSALLGLLVTATFLHAFARRDRRYLVPFVAVLATMLYTHNWAIFVAGGTVVALGALWRWAAPADRRGLVRDALLAYGGAGLLWLPWLPTLAFQALHTGAPWAERPPLDAITSGVALVLGGATPAVALLLVAGNGLATLVREEHDRRVAALIALGVSAVLLAWLASQVSPAFANRYFAAFVGPLVLLAAVGVSAAGRYGLLCLLLIAAFWFDPRTGDLNTKSNVRSVAASVQTLVTAGDLIVSTHPEHLSVVAYYMPDGVRYADSLGPVEDPRVFDWRDAEPRLAETYAKPTIDRLVRTLEPGQELVLVQPLLRSGRWGAPWTRLVRRRSLQWEHQLNEDRRMRREAAFPVFGYDRLPRGIRAVVYRRK